MTGFRARLRRGEDLLLVNPNVVASAMVELLAGAGADALMLDLEQGALDFHQLDELTRVARGFRLPVLARVFSSASWVIEKTLMRGVKGLIVPRQSDPIAIARVADEIAYSRPQDAEEVALVVQIEDREAVAALDGFAAIERIDCLFPGPVDLAKSHGLQGVWQQEPFLTDLKALVRRIRGLGKPCAMLVDAPTISTWRTEGVSLFYTHARDFLRDGVQRCRNEFASG